ncbi:MAG TPA: response regulator transcription factor [Geomonas sp.]
MDILIVEDTRTIRSKLVALLDGQHDYNVVAAVASAEEAQACLSVNTVQLVILDLGLPGISDGAAVTAIKAVRPDVNILVYTASADDNKIYSALKAGAIGYLLKSAQPLQIIAAIEEIKAGGAPMSPTIALKVLQEFLRQPDREESKKKLSPLSNRETQILTLLYRGDNLNQMADELCISLHTVRVHIKKIYSKLMVNSRSHAIYQGLQKDLIQR